MKEIIKDLQGQLEYNAFEYQQTVMKIEAGESNLHPANLQLWEERIEALAEAIGILTKHLNK